MNRKHTGSAEEPQPMSKDKERQFSRYSVIGLTIAAVIYTIYAFWLGNYHTRETALLGWFAATWAWWFWLFEQRKVKR